MIRSLLILLVITGVVFFFFFFFGLSKPWTICKSSKDETRATTVERCRVVTNPSVYHMNDAFGYR